MDSNHPAVKKLITSYRLAWLRQTAEILRLPSNGKKAEVAIRIAAKHDSRKRRCDA